MGSLKIYDPGTSAWKEFLGSGGSGSGGGAGVTVAPSGDTTGSTDRANIQAALDQQSAAGGGRVALLGEYHINAPLKMTTATTLDGTNPVATQIHLAPGSNCNGIEINTGAYQWGLTNLVYDGHSESNTTGAGLYLVATTPAYSDADGFRGGPWNLVDRVYIHYTAGHGVHIQGGNGGMNESRISNVYSIRAGGCGFYMRDFVDSFIENVSTGESKSHGMHLYQCGDLRISDCKFWYTGWWNTRGNPPALQATPGSGVAFTQAYDIEMSNVTVQDINGYGFELGVTASKLDILANSTILAPLRMLGTADSIVNLTIGITSHNIVAPHVVEHNNSKRCRVTTTYPGNAGVFGVQKAIASTDHSWTRLNVIKIGTPETVLDTDYAATITPDFCMGGIRTTLTGNVTIANPLDNIYGYEVAVELVQDATGGRTVTWGNKYIGTSPASTAANARNVWRFRCDGVTWRQIEHYTV